MFLLHIIPVEWFERIGWMLLHSLWELAAIGLIVRWLLWRAHARPATYRYAVACSGLGLMVAASLATALLVRTSGFVPYSAAAPTQVAAQPDEIPGDIEPPAKMKPKEVGDGATRAAGRHAPPQASPHEPSFTENISLFVLPWLPQLVVAWAVGVVALGGWHVAGWVSLWHLHRTASVVQDVVLLRRLELIRVRMIIARQVRLLLSDRVPGPVTFGWLRPVIVAPASVLMGMTPDQLDAIFAHELAHIQRYDYLVNLLQTATETILFYHPAVWWLSRQVRLEREHCCDDVAVPVCGSATVYAKALASLEEVRAAGRLQLAATGGLRPESTLSRVRRVLGVSPERTLAGNMRLGIGGVLASFLLLTNLSGGVLQQYWRDLEFARLAAPLRAYEPDYVTPIEQVSLEAPNDNKAEFLAMVRPAFVAEEASVRVGPSSATNAKSPKAIPIGASKEGGRPDLPANVAWPTWKGHHLSFIAQVNLEKLPDIPGRELLPATGRLYFFYAVFCPPDYELRYGERGEEGTAPVIYSDAPLAKLASREFPADLEDEQKLEEEPLHFHIENTVADSEHPLRRDRYEQMKPLNKAWQTAQDNGSWPRIQILGFPNNMQNSVGVDIEASLQTEERNWDKALRRAGEWELLFQSIDLIDDCSLYYMIRREDLKNRRWDKAWFCLQCT